MKSRSASKTILREIRIQAKCLKSGKQKVKSYPESFRTLVVDAVREGAAVVKVAEATGVSPFAIYSWKKASGPIVRKLKVTDDDGQSVSRRLPVKIFIGTKVHLELPVENLTTALMSKLAALE